MEEANAVLESPIDVMYLLHKGLSAQAERVQRLIEDFEIGGSLQSFTLEFNQWAIALAYHAQIEDEHMTAPLTDCPPARDNETEHVVLAEQLGDMASLLEKDDKAGLKERVKGAMAVLAEEQHSLLMERLEDVLEVLSGEIGRTRVIARTKRHLYGKVVALRITQDDHFESEEAFVLPLVHERMSDAEELELVRRLLIDDKSDDSRWVLDWLLPQLTPHERELIAGIESEFQRLPAAAD